MVGRSSSGKSRNRPGRADLGGSGPGDGLLGRWWAILRLSLFGGGG